jgi:hypothetical protein
MPIKPLQVNLKSGNVRYIENIEPVQLSKPDPSEERFFKRLKCFKPQSSEENPLIKMAQNAANSPLKRFNSTNSSSHNYNTYKMKLEADSKSGPNVSNLKSIVKNIEKETKKEMLENRRILYDNSMDYLFNQVNQNHTTNPPQIKLNDVI